jgi:NADPH:quinone reductase-like Zn-dependent oxidoreductase
LTNKRGVDVVIEHVGEATWAKSVRALARGGRLVTCGATTGPKGAVDLAALFSKQLSLLGSYMGTKGELLEASRHFFAGRLRPVVDRTYPLADARAAQERLEQSNQFGKIVLEI